MSEPTPTIFPERPVAFDLTAFVCPRCEAVTAAEAYGPCATCVADLHTTVRGEARHAAVLAYEPKMNVTPNAVATKE